MNIRSIRVEVYRGSSPHEIMVEVQLEDRNLGGGVWQAGRAVRIEGTGPSGRKQVEGLIREALDQLVKPYA